MKNFINRFILGAIATIFIISSLNLNSIYAQNIENTETIDEVQKIESNVTNEAVTSNDPLSLTSETAVLIDANTGYVVYDKLKDVKVFPASTTKVLTALLALEYGKLDETLTFSERAVKNIGKDRSNIGMLSNEQITLEQGLYAVMLSSANEVCNAIAEHISGSIEDFVVLMNKRAKELGVKNSNFANPHGYHDENHYTTSNDMALIMKEAIKIAKFREIISTVEYTIPSTNLNKNPRLLTNRNKLINPDSEFYYQYCIGSNTGYTSNAGNTLVSYGEKNNIKLIAVVMKNSGTEIYTNTKTLFEYGFANYSEQKVFDTSEFTGTINVVQKYNDQTIELGKVDLFAEKNLALSLPSSFDKSLVIQKLNIQKNFEAPVKKNQVMGTLDLTYDGNVLGTVNVLAKSEILPKSETISKIKETFKKVLDYAIKVLKIILIIAIVMVVILLFIAIRLRRKKRNNIYKNQVYYKNNVYKREVSENKRNRRTPNIHSNPRNTQLNESYSNMNKSEHYTNPYNREEFSEDYKMPSPKSSKINKTTRTERTERTERTRRKSGRDYD